MLKQYFFVNIFIDLLIISLIDLLTCTNDALLSLQILLFVCNFSERISVLRTIDVYFPDSAVIPPMTESCNHVEFPRFWHIREKSTLFHQKMEPWFR